MSSQQLLTNAELSSTEKIRLQNINNSDPQLVTA